LRLDRVAGYDGDAEQVARGRLPGGRVDQVVELPPRPPPAAAVAARGGEGAAVRELEGDRIAGRRDGDRPGTAARSDVAARVDEAWAGRGENLGRPLGGVALADAAEVDARAAAEGDHSVLD